MRQYFNITHSFITSLSRRRDGAGAAIDDGIEERDLAKLGICAAGRAQNAGRSHRPPPAGSPQITFSPMLSLLPRARSAAVRGIALFLVWLDGVIFHVYLLFSTVFPVARYR
jgi:hypothetical protein